MGHHLDEKLDRRERAGGSLAASPRGAGRGTAWLSSSLSCLETVEPSLWVSDPRSGIMVRLMVVSAVRASAEKIETCESSLEKFKRRGVSVGESGAVILGRLGAEGMSRCSACAWGVPRRGKRGCIRLPFLASLSASLLSSMVTCDGTLTQWSIRPGRSSSVSSYSQRGALGTSPDDPTQPLSFHRLAAPAAPSMTYCESVQIAISPEVKICSALRAAKSSAELLVWRRCSGT